MESVLKIIEHEDNWSLIALRLLNQHDYELKIVGKKNKVCKDTKYNLGECRRVLQTVVKSHRSASSKWMPALP